MELALSPSSANRRELATLHDNPAVAAQARALVAADTSSRAADEYVLQGEVLSGRGQSARDPYAETYGPAKQSSQQTSYQPPQTSVGQIRNAIEAYMEQPRAANGALLDPQRQIDYYV